MKIENKAGDDHRTLYISYSIFNKSDYIYAFVNFLGVVMVRY